MAEAYPPPGMYFLDRIPANTIGKLNAGVFIPNLPKRFQYGIISVGDDKRLKVWIKHDGIADQIIHEHLPAIGTTLVYDDRNNRLYVGLDNGTIKLYIYPYPEKDFTKLKFIRDFEAHKKRIVGLYFSETTHWVLSCAEDNLFIYHCVKTGDKLGEHQLQPMCTKLQYDYINRNVFISDTCGDLTVINLESGDIQCEEPFKLHRDAINTLVWSGTTRLLYSTTATSSNIIVWEPDTRVTVFELSGHLIGTKITALTFSNKFSKAFSAGEDSTFVMWEQRVQRKQRPIPLRQQWCVGCKQPFFWNIPKKAALLKLGETYHHCQACGQSVCQRCPMYKLIFPAMGFEIEANMCQFCYESHERLKKIHLAFFYNVDEGEIRYMAADDDHKLVLTAGFSNIKVWDLTSLLQ